MRIFIATPISLPEIGGPAVFAGKLKEGLEKHGNLVKVVSYHGLKEFPQPLKIFLYFLRVFRAAKNYDLIYAFNLISCGLPALLVSKILRKKFLIRIGGDFLWERAVEEGRTQKPLREYYDAPKTFKEKFWSSFIKKVLNGADKIVFTSRFQRDLYLKHFGTEEKKTAIIQNPFPEINYFQEPAGGYQLLFAGRLIKLKNLDRLIEAFAKAAGRADKNPTLKIIGKGPEQEKLKVKSQKLKIDDRVIFESSLAHEELLKEIQRSYLCILPSFSEITPNFALECIKLRKPILLTKETALYEALKESLIFIDPQNEKDLAEKILELLNEKNYQNYLERIKKIPTNRNWDDVVKEHEKSFVS